MEWFGTIKRMKSQFFVMTTLMLVLAASSSVKAADNIVIGMAGLNFSFLPFQIALEKRFYEKHDLNVKPVLMRAQAGNPGAYIRRYRLRYPLWFAGSRRG